jgi:hypothetical protein
MRNIARQRSVKEQDIARPGGHAEPCVEPAAGRARIVYLSPAAGAVRETPSRLPPGLY